MVRQNRGECQRHENGGALGALGADPSLPAVVWGSVVSSPSGVWGGAPAQNDFRAFWPKNLISGGINFYDYPENQLTKFCAVYTVKAIFANRDKKSWLRSWRLMILVWFLLLYFVIFFSLFFIIK